MSAIPGKESQISTKVTLPSSEDLFKRLKAASNDSYTVRWLYPRFLVHAEKEMSVIEIVELVIYEVAKNVKDRAPSIARAVRADTPGFLDAIIVDPVANAEAKALYLEIHPVD